VIGLGFSLCGGMSFSAILVNWFERRRARALALMQVGRGVGGLMVMGVAASLEAFGWRTTMFASGAIFLLAGSWVAAAMRDTPGSVGLRPDGDPPETAPSTDDGARHAIHPGLPIAASMRTAAFWQINAANALLSLVVTALVAHLAVHLREVGYSLSFAATMVASVTFASTAGLLVAGAIGDRLPKRFVTAWAAFGHAAAVATLALSIAPGWVIAAVIVHGFAWGVRDPLMVAMRVDYFGRGAFVHVEGIARVFVGFGMVAGPVVIAFLRERGGDFAGGFWLLAGLGIVAAAALGSARPPRRN
jgi:sugar phosphate permease